MTMNRLFSILNPIRITGTAVGPGILFIAAMVIGGVVGTTAPAATGVLGSLIDPLIVLVVSLVFIELRLDGIGKLRHAPRLAGLVLGVNFLVAPVVAWGLSTLFVADDALRLGVLIYCLFPCTDWFLAFTRTAGGDTTTGAAVIPVSMVLQLALFPVYLALFAGETVGPTAGSAGATLAVWFLIPLGIAIVVRLALRLTVAPERRQAARDVVGRTVPFALAVMIVALFAANVDTLATNLVLVPIVLAVVAAFFVVMAVIGELIVRGLRLPYPERSLLLISISARNAPLMLALVAATLPNQPMVVAAIVVGMLLEFPHLTLLTSYLRRSRPIRAEAGAS